MSQSKKEQHQQQQCNRKSLLSLHLLPNGQSRSRVEVFVKNAPDVVDLVDSDGDDDDDNDVGNNHNEKEHDSKLPLLSTERTNQNRVTGEAQQHLNKASSNPLSSTTKSGKKQSFREAFKNSRRSGVFTYKRSNLLGVKRKGLFTEDDRVTDYAEAGGSSSACRLDKRDYNVDRATTVKVHASSLEPTSTAGNSHSYSPLKNLRRRSSPNKPHATNETNEIETAALRKNPPGSSKSYLSPIKKNKTDLTADPPSTNGLQQSLRSSHGTKETRKEAIHDSARKMAQPQQLQPRSQSPCPRKRPTSSPQTRQATLSLMKSSDTKVSQFADQQDDEKSVSGIPPVLSLDNVEGSCWVCRIPLRVPAGQFCFYETHDHPVLHVPVCCLCCDEIAALRIEAETNNLDSTDFCSGCALGDDHDFNDNDDDDDEAHCLFLCDTCDCAFCFQCVARALGGGSVGKEAARQLRRDVDEPWNCLACEPPTSFLQVRNQLEGQQSPTTTTTTTPAAEDLISDLDALEGEKDRCLNELESNEYTQEILIRRELSRKWSGVELEEAVEAALDEWREEWSRHEARIASKIASIHDMLENEHGIDLAACYKTCLRRWESLGDDQELPEWAKAADRALHKREMASEIVPDYCVQDHSVYEIEDLKDDDVEDLDAYEPEDTSRLRKAGWSRGRPSPNSITMALKAEDERIQNAHIRLKGMIREEEDIILMREEQLFVAGGPSKRRRDATQITQQKLKKTTSNTKIIKQPVIPLTASKETVARNTAAQREERNGASPPLARAETAGYNILSRDTKCETRIVGPQNSVEKAGADGSFLITSQGSKEDSCQSDKCNSVILCSTTAASIGNYEPIRTVAVVEGLGKHLKPHQIAGVKFMWKCVFSDFETEKLGNPNDPGVGGVVLAHNMGLGKSLSAISIMHTVLTSNSMQSPSGEQLVKTVLLICPVNTLANWEAEFDKWLGNIRPSITVYPISSIESKSRHVLAKRWKQQGGVLLMSSHLFVSLLLQREETFGEELQPDVLVLDEAHLMLKSKNSETYRVLSQVKTPRRIALTGSPFQNNLFEYFRMIKFLRPNAIPITDEAIFERKFVIPILNGLHADSSAQLIQESDSKTEEFLKLVSPFVHRVDASELMKDLPPLQQAVLHVRQTRIQVRLFSTFKRLQSGSDVYRNFFKTYQQLMPVCNHPGCLLEKGHLQRTQPCEQESDFAWWKPIFDKSKNEFQQVESGAKFLVLLHIVAYAELHQEKVLIFSKCLKTLDFVEKVFSLPDWTKHVPSLKEHFPNLNLGGWVRNTHYCRIDGQTSASTRGELINKFNDSSSDGSGVRAFLISVLAGGLGINLYSASRVVLLDSHFNPSVTTQAIYRAYRYGQTLPVHCYRLLTEGTMEEKVYRRAVNKSGVANRVIDKKSIRRNFTANEVRDLQSSYTWAQCDNCDKWRMLLSATPGDELPDKWYCNMNELDPVNNTCEASEKSQRWYEMNAFSRAGEQAVAVDDVGAMSDAEKQKLVQNDELLRILLKISSRNPKDSAQRASTIVSQYYFHDALFGTEASKKPKEEMNATAAVKKEDIGFGSSDTSRMARIAQSQESIIDLCSSDDDEDNENSNHPFDEMFI